jgi:predicted kinase
MSKLIVMKGLPASGKTTEANRLVSEEGFKRVNKDDLRGMIDSSKWSKENEKQIIECRDLLVINYLDNGYNVVVDDTNFHPSHIETLVEIADNCDAEFEVKFIDTPVMVCIERDAKRGDKSVGAKVIMGMYNEYLKPEPPEWSNDKQNCYIFDIDGTLALMNGRSPYDYSKVLTDLPNHNITSIARLLAQSGLPIILVSGREDSCALDTMKWLEKFSIPYDYLYMRRTGDSRNDTEIKKEIYELNIKDNFNVLAVFDDRNRVVDMWRSLGLTTLQVAYGYF